MREAPFLGVPSLEVGTRQNRRASGASITACSAFDTETVDRFLLDRWGHRFSTDITFGSGNAAERFVKVLISKTFWDRPMQKAFADE